MTIQRRSAFVGFVALATLILLAASFLRLADLHRFPPALHYDEAADMLLSRDIAFYGYNPFPVVEAYSGREALFYYLAVPLLRILGTEIFATRLTSALLGILTVAATIALGKTLLRSRFAGLLAGAWLTVNGAQIWLTRQGFRTSPQPLLEALSLWLLWLALRRQRGGWRAALAGGVCGGLALYVYMAARIFPPWLVGVLGLGLLAHLLDVRREGWTRWRHLVGRSAAFLVALGLTALPIAYYYVTHLTVLTDRLAQLAPSADTPTLAQSLQLHLQMFFLNGDPLLRYNLYPGRPFFDWITGGLMCLGLALALQWSITRHGEDRLVGLFLVCTPLLILPSVIAVNGLPPSHMRSVAMVPLIFFLPTLPVMVVWRWLQRGSIWRRRGWGSAFAAALTVLLCGVVLWTWRDYQAWGARVDLFYHSDGDLDLAARWLEQQARPDDIIYVASRYYEHPTILAHRLDSAQIRWMMDDHLFLPPPRRTALLIFPRTAPAEPWRGALNAAWRLTDLPLGPDGQAAFEAYRVPAQREPQTDTPALSVSRVLSFDSAEAASLTAGQAGTILSRWQILTPPARNDLAPVIAIMDQWGNEVTRVTPYMEQSSRWLAGETLILRPTVIVPNGNPRQNYTVRVTWVGKAAQNDYLPLVDANGRFAGIWYTQPDPIIVQRGAPIPITAASTVSAVVQLAPGLALEQVLGLPAQLDQGQLLQFTAIWRATQAQTNSPVVVEVQPLDPASGSTQPKVLWRGAPVHDQYPFDQWQAPESVIDRYSLPIPVDLPAGDYRLILRRDEAADESATGQPLRAWEHLLTINAVARSFTPPAWAIQSRVSVGEAIELIGYDAQPTTDSTTPDAATPEAATVTVRLAWRARLRPTLDYTLFIHVIDSTGAVFSQIDRSPVRPTSQWVEGEVTLYTSQLKVPTGAYRIEVGLYTLESGRLAVRQADQTAAQLVPDSVVVPVTR